MVESWKDVLMSGITMCVGGLEAEDDGVTKQFVGKNAAWVVTPNRAANATLMSGRCGLQ